MNTFSITAIREARGLSRTDLAKKAGFSNADSVIFSKYETGVRPLDYEKLLALAKVLNVSPRWFFKSPVVLDSNMIIEFLRELAESEFRFEIKLTKGQYPYLVFPEEVKNKYLKDWRDKKLAFKKGEMSEEDYYNYKSNLVLYKVPSDFSDFKKVEVLNEARRIRILRENRGLTANDVGVKLIEADLGAHDYLSFEGGFYDTLPQSKIDKIALSLGIYPDRLTDNFFFDTEEDVVQFLLAVDLLRDIPVLIDASLDVMIQDKKVAAFLTEWEHKAQQVADNQISIEAYNSWLQVQGV